MNIIVYRGKNDGKIRWCQEINEKYISAEDLPQKIEDYNKSPCPNTSQLYVITPGSVEEFLWNEQKAIRNLKIDTLRDLQSSLESAQYLVDDLLCQLKQESL